ncbi:N-acyl homoserine lactonase family protein [Paenibacillus polymyxa]|nr:N-acyl homoserine lactonase family protein [Paenibacillus polymyxa]
MINKLYWLPVGQLDIDRSSLNHHAQPGELVRLQIWSYLLETDHGPILIDTGMPDSFIDNPNYFKGTPFEGRFIPHMTADDRIVAVLDRIGYQPEDIYAIVISHMHMDHAGGNPHFPNTPIYVQQTEADAAIDNLAYAPPECVQADLNYRLLQGDHELVPGLQLLYTPGHSPGHQSALVTTKESGPIMLTIDVAYTQENYTNDVPFDGFNREQARQSIARIQQIVQEIKPNFLFFGHDPEQVAVRPVYPQYK